MVLVNRRMNVSFLFGCVLLQVSSENTATTVFFSSSPMLPHPATERGRYSSSDFVMLNANFDGHYNYSSGTNFYKHLDAR